jgi:putative ABC transport system permease protein
MAGPVGLGTVAVAVVMLLAAARSWLQRRSQEVTLLALRGAGPGALATKAVLELLPPMLLGGAVGLVGALAVVRTVGPGPRVDPDAVAAGVVLVTAAVLGALIAAGLVVAGGVHRVGVAIGRAAVTASRRWWWELLVLAVAAATLYELRTRDSPLIDETRVDALLLLFPLLLIVGGAGLLARLLLAARPLSWLATRLPTPAWLAARRLSAARARAALIVTGAALAIGIVSFAGTLSTSLRATAYAKQVLGVGAPQAVRLTEPVELPDLPSLQGISTVVTRTNETGVVRRGHTSADVLGVDPDTFADGAFWDETFADRPLDELLACWRPARRTGFRSWPSARGSPSRSS